MFAAILGFFQALPELVSLFKDLNAKISELIQIQKDNALTAKVKDALSKAVQTKDTSELEAIFRGSK